MDKNSKILVTGASGLIGSALVRLLGAEGYTSILHPRRHELDLWNYENVQWYFDRHKPERIFHLAACVGGISQNISEPAEFSWCNTIMYCNIFKAFRKLGWSYYGCNRVKLLFPGSACAYPKKALQPIKEQDFLSGPPEETNLAYAVAKQNGIVMAQSYAKQYGMNVVLPMIANTYGPDDRSTHVIPDLIRKFREAKANKDPKAVLWGTGKPLREFIYSLDVANALLFLMKNYDSPKIINVGSMREISIHGLAYRIAEMVGYDGEIEFDSSKPDGAMRKVLDSSRMRQMGWQPKVDIDTGLFLMLEKYA